MPRLPGLWPSRCACGLRGFSTGHPCPVEKLAASMRPPCGLSSTRPPRHTGTPVARATSRAEPRLALPGPSFVGAHPVRERRPQGGLLGRVRAQGALLQGNALACGWRINAAAQFLVGAHPVRDKPTERYTQRGCRAQGAFPKTSGHTCDHALVMCVPRRGETAHPSICPINKPSKRAPSHDLIDPSQRQFLADTPSCRSGKRSHANVCKPSQPLLTRKPLRRLPTVI